MDKKSITGLVLIFAIFVGYMWWVSPSKEEQAAMKARHDSIVAAYLDSVYQDSVMKAETAALQQHLRDSILAVNPDAVVDFEALANGSLTRGEKERQLGMFAGNIADRTDTLHVTNKVFDVDLVNLGAIVNQVVLKDYFTYDSLPLILISPAEDNMNLVFSTNDNRVINTKDIHFSTFVDGKKVEGSQDISIDGDAVVVSYRAYAQEAMDTMMMASAGDQYLEFQYTFYADRYDVDFDINFHGLSSLIRSDNYMDFQWKNRMNRQEKVDQSTKGSRNRNKDAEKFNSNVYFKPVKDKVDNLKLGGDSDKNVKTAVEWVAFKQQFFCAILMGDTPFENADLSNRTDRNDTASNYLCDMASTIGLTYDSEKDCSMNMQFYFGPSKYRELRDMHKGFERMLPLGWGFFLIHWTSRLLITCFNFLEQFNWNYGIIIIIITLLLRIVLLPLVWNSYKTGAISKILRPEMDALNKKYPNQEQAMQKQQEMMRLQRAAGINPMMGCLPMLIQLPILWAMFRFFPAAIELRQQHFLWCDDLSTYDSIWDFGFNIPMYGDHMSLFCIIMFAIQFFYTWYTMRNTPQNASMPGMKFMMYFMPFMMLFIFNSQSAALNLYYAVSLSLTMIVMMLIRKFTSEEKVRAKMAAYNQKQNQKNGKGGGKKSKFQQRLEEYQKMAEQAQKMQQRR